MFSNLVQFDFVRNGKQAFGFYIAYLFFGLLLAVALRVVLGVLATGDGFIFLGFIFLASRIFAVLMCLALVLVIGYKKSLFSSFKVLILIVVTIILSVFLSILGGLIPIAYLTTLNNNT